VNHQASSRPQFHSAGPRHDIPRSVAVESSRSRAFRFLVFAVFCGTLIWSAGCEQTPAGAVGSTSLPRVGVGSQSWYDDFQTVNAEAGLRSAQAIYGVWGDGWAFVILTDEVTPGSQAAGGSRRANYNGQLHAAGSRNVDWRCETGDGTNGSMEINGMKYDLAQGNLFLVATKTGKVNVRQIQRKFPTTESKEENLKSLISSEPQLGSFFPRPKSDGSTH
jgi:hypothetical protein